MRARTPVPLPLYRRRMLIVPFLTVVSLGAPDFASASTIWQSASTHTDEVLVYTPQLNNSWFNGTRTAPTIKVGLWSQPTFVTDASTTLHMWARWNGSYISTLSVLLNSSSGGDPFYGIGSTTAEVVTPFNDDYYRLDVYATSSLQEYAIPARPGIAIRTGDELWAFVYPSWAAYGANHWVGSSSSSPYFELCEGPCTGNNSPPSITLLGDATTTVELGSAFTDPGATASDAIDGDITNTIHVTGSVDTGVVSTTTLVYSVTNSRGTSASTTRTVIVACAQGCHSNVLFLPGIEGSRLYYRDIIGLGVGIERQVWEPDFHTDIPYLAMNTDGTSKYPLYTKDKDIIDSLYGNNVSESVAAKLKLGEEGVQVYGDLGHFMDALVASGTIKEWRAYPYDWRYDVRDIVNDGTLTQMPDNTVRRVYLKNVLEEMASTSPSGKVTIVAHSNGGLLAKALVVSLGADSSKYINRIIMVGTPQWGTPSDIGVMLHGDDQTLGLGLIMQGNEVRAVTETLPGVYDLLPSPAYFSHSNDPVAIFDPSGFFSGKFATSFGSTLSSLTALRDFITDSAGLNAQVGSANDLRTPLALSSSLVDKAVATHAVLDAWTPPEGITVSSIAGWGQDTVKSLAYATGSKVVCTNLVFTNACASAPVLSHTPVLTQDGDGTVVSPSAVGDMSSGLYFNEKDFENQHLGKIIHQNITSATPIQTAIADLLKGTTIVDNVFIKTIKPTGGTNPIELRVSTHSPVNLVVTDANGNQSGVLPLPGTDFSGVKRDIPGSSVQVFDDEQYINVPQSGSYKIAMSGYASGSATLDIDTIGSAGAVTATTTFTNIPTTASSTATVSVINGAPDTLAVDVNGDGMSDFTAIPISPSTDPLEYIRYMRSTVKALQLAKNTVQMLDVQLATMERAIVFRDADKKHRNNPVLYKYKTITLVAELEALKRSVEMQIRLSTLKLPYGQSIQLGVSVAKAEVIIGMINQLETLL